VRGSLRRRDGPEPLLTRRVPDLQLDPLSVDVDRSDLKVHPDGGDVAACRRRRTSDTTAEHHMTPTTNRTLSVYISI